MPADAPLLPSRHLQPPQGNERLVYMLFAFLAVVVAILMVIAITSIGGGSSRAGAEATAASRLPPYWTVRGGQTYAEIAEQTGLSVSDLETFNPRVNPASIMPGQRLKLRARVPPPPPKPKGPEFWKVRSGQTLASIADKAGRNVFELRRLNPGLTPTELQPGDRVRLRR